MDGVLVVDKPAGLTSHDVVAAVRRLLGLSRVGHTGTLDPLATGVLPLACGRATRLVRFLSASDKAYDATIRFGLTTDTYDITGDETGRSVLRPSREAVVQALEALRGESTQTPPPFSAKKIGGRRAYDLARKARPPVLTPVSVRLSRADVTGFSGDQVVVSLTCSAGFYVRALAHELGARLGMGACLEALRRTRSGQFGLEEAVTLERLQAGAVSPIPMGALLPDLAAVTVTEEGRRRVAHGRSLDAAHCGEAVRGASLSGWVRLFDAEGTLVALGQPGESETLHPEVVLI